jgi:hypothetical protein
VLCNLLCFRIVDFLCLVAPEWFLSSQSFHFVNKYLVFFKFCIYDILLHTNTHLVNLEVIIYFQFVYHLDRYLENMHVLLGFKTYECE